MWSGQACLAEVSSSIFAALEAPGTRPTAHCVWASRSQLKRFVRLARTIRQHKEGILAYIDERLTNGLAEGIKNRLRTITRQAYGFHSAEALIAMLYLCARGIALTPPLPAH